MKTFIVDSFSSKPFKGNPAGVCFLEKDLNDNALLNIAKELNFSETAFVQSTTDPNHFTIRYFSPKLEIPLCGHATLAAAKVIFKEDNLEAIKFTTIENIDLHITIEGELIVMEFPIYNTIPHSAPSSMLAALGLNKIISSHYNKETNIIMLEIEDPKVLAALKPNYEALIKSHDSIHGVLITAKADDSYDFHSRFFWPWAGTNEDPVTGGTHTFLSKYWSEKLNKKKLKSFQSSERSGDMELELISDAKVLIKAEATITFRGELLI